MALLSGTKRWRFFDREEIPLLYRNHFCDGIFKCSSDDPDLTRDCPAFALARRRYEVVLQPGELLFVPAGTPHEVMNLGERNISVSSVILM
jgi:hypothetical protein